MGESTAAERAAKEREAQGLPLLIDDPLAYRDLAVLMGWRSTAKQQRRAS